MKEFLIRLYENPSFPIYLGAIILVLVIAFFVIFFLGKRDQKNYEKTQRLETIHDNAFQEGLCSLSKSCCTKQVQAKILFVHQAR